MTFRPRSEIAVLTVVLVAALPARAQEDLNDLLEKAVKAAVAKVAPSVVQIETTGGTELISTGPRGMQVRKGVGPTTGVIVAEDGYIISSAFNFANKPSAIVVAIPGHKERYAATVVATDRTRMLTLLKITVETKLPVATPTPKKEITVGQSAIALGRTLDRTEDRDLNQLPSVSVGIISAINRIWGKAIQTDAKVSPGNYGGPLVDITGRVQGILVPASPREEGETAGIEWYDSGIGFAIPLEDVLAVLPRLREGKDLQRGLLGITMQGADQYGSPPVVGTIQPDSAAAKSGIKPGDKIVEIDGKAVNSQAQLLHQLGHKYDGDIVTVVIERGGEKKKLENLRLSASLTSFPQSFLGVLPVRDDPELGEEVHYVYPKGPADAAGIKAGDRIMKIGMAGQMMLQQVNGRDHLSQILRTLPPGTEIKIEVKRKDGDKTDTLTVKLGTVPDEVPDRLPGDPSRHKALEKRKDNTEPNQPKVDPKKKPETGLLKRTASTGSGTYYVFVPDDYDPNIAYAAVLWLHPVGKGKEKDIEDFRDAWDDVCSAHQMIVVAPITDNEQGWTGTDVDFVQQALRDVLSQYTIDKQRVVAHGMGVGGKMAFYLGFQARDLIRAVATTGAVLASPAKNNVPTQPLAFYLVAGGKDPLAKEIAETAKQLSDKKYSVVHHEIPTMGHQYLDVRTLLELVRWIDSLDRQ
jgi:S1-C subfamily serine protease/predicted esterase